MGYFSDLAIMIEQEGWDAAAKGKSRLSCPYPEGSAERPYWMQGWDDFELYSRETLRTS